MPRHLDTDRGSDFPQLEALVKLDAAGRLERARQLIFVAAATHRTADERRTAEYFLRNRRPVAEGGTSALALLSAARCAAEMDVRRVHLREPPVPRETFAMWAADQPMARTDDPSVGEMVLEKLRIATGHGPTATVAVDRILDAVSIALELAERHALNGGNGPALLGMRADARKESRLVTHLRGAFGNDAGARSVARLLVGADGTPIESALLWWSARSTVTAGDVPPAIRDRWMRCLRTAEAAFRAEAVPTLSR